ncbi:MAG TPA: radical SAM protein [Phycisphaerae bacterium]|nr:radical SAM protein [Phycisphaerae bacterium]
MTQGLVTNHAIRGLLYREAVRRGATRLPYAPSTIYLDVCNACNLKCTFCPQSHWEGGPRGRMAWPMFERALAQVADLAPARLFLFCYGEPTLHDRLADMVKAAVDAGLRVRLHTNAAAVTDEMARGLIEAGLQECRFSFDTADRELYERMRSGSRFDQTVANIRRMVELRARARRRHPVFELQEIVPYVAGVPARNTEAYRRLFEGLDVRVMAKFMHSFAGQGSEKEFAGQRAEGRSHCSQLYRRIVVNFDGKVHACCLDPFGYNVVGDLAQGDTVAGAWNSTRMMELRDRTNRGDVADLPPCNGCEMLTRAAPTARRGPAGLLASVLWRLTGAGA